MKGFTKFSQIEKKFDKSNNWHLVTHKSFTLWFLEPKNSIRNFVNGTDANGYLIKIESYIDLKNKIQDKLRKMGYSDVSEIPEDIIITYE